MYRASHSMNFNFCFQYCFYGFCRKYHVDTPEVLIVLKFTSMETTRCGKKKTTSSCHMRSRTIWWNQSTTHTKFENDFAIIIVRLRCRSRQTSDMMTISFVGLSPLSKKTQEAEKSKSRHFCRVRFRWRRLVMRETRTTAHTLSALFCWGGETRCASSFFFGHGQKLK